jgi:type I restriction enzyme S subunit
LKQAVKSDRVQLGEVCAVGDGAHASIPRAGSGVKYLSAKNFRSGGLRLDSVEYISRDSFERFFRERGNVPAIPHEGDVLVSIIGTLGEPYVVRAHDEFGLSSSVAILRPNTDQLLPEYLYYWMRSPLFQDSIYAIKGGVAQNYVSLAMIKSLPVILRPLDAQRKIVAVLSVYDDLIENNSGRIKVLEEMAQRIYREWFVDFRYPGREGMPLVESELGPVPGNWSIGTVDDHVDVLRGRSYRSVDLAEDGGVPFFNLKCIARDGGFRPEGIKRYIGDFKEGQKASAGDIIVAVTDMTQERRIVARAARVPDVGEECGVFSMDLVKIVPKDLPSEYVLGMLRYSEFPDRVKAHANGANVLHLQPDRIRQYRSVFPVPTVARQYADQVGPMQHLADRLEAASDRLRATRDLLLPRLVSGAIDVAELDIAVPEIAA